MEQRRTAIQRFAALSLGIGLFAWGAAVFDDDDNLDRQLKSYLHANHFTGKMQSQLATRLGHTPDPRLANIGRLLWFDTITGLNDDNTCAGCHSPTAGFGDSQSIAIGIENNGIVGPHRKGPRNQRRSPLVLNTAFYPALMWNGRFSSNSGDPFNNNQGFTFPPPEGQTLSGQPHLLNAQAFIPPTERVEAAGFNFPGGNQEIRDEVINRLNGSKAYRQLFAGVFSDVANGGPITYDMFAAAIAEFECELVFADAPIDRYARGNTHALSASMKKGAVLFFGKAKCVSCHSVSGQSNEMFSDFKEHVAGTPQIVPRTANVVFDGPGQNEDFGLEQVTGSGADRYKFRSSPLRNIGLQPTFFHNGAFTDLEDAIRYHADPKKELQRYSTRSLDRDLQNPLAPMQHVLARLDQKLLAIPKLSGGEIKDLAEFVGKGLLDPRANPQAFRQLVPRELPSGRDPLRFEF
jgi:cytochrome c peroxidase